MTAMNSIAAIALLLLLAKWMTQLWLDHLNRRYVLQHAGSVPEPFKDFVDEATYSKSIQYTLAKGTCCADQTQASAISTFTDEKQIQVREEAGRVQIESWRH